MKIAILVDNFPKLSETFVVADAVQLAERGHEVTVLCRNRHPIGPGLTPDQIAALSRVTVRVWPGMVWERIGFRPWRLRQRLIRLTDRLLRGILSRQDVLYAHFAWQGTALVSLFGERLPAPLVTIYHGRDVSNAAHEGRLGELRDLLHLGALHLTVNCPFARILKEAGAPPDRVAVHHLGVPVRALGYAPSGWTGPVRLISLCRLVEKKGISVALEALARLARERPEFNWHYEIAGDGPLEAALRRQAEALGLSDRVTFSGPQPHDEAKRRIAAADVLLAPSVTGADGDQEGIPVTLMEAMALGTIVCSTRHSGIPELVEDGVEGLLSAEHDAAGLCDNLARLMDGALDRDAMARAARAKVEAAFDQDRSGDALVEVFERARDGRHFDEPVDSSGLNAISAAMSGPHRAAMKKGATQ